MRVSRPSGEYSKSATDLFSSYLADTFRAADNPEESLSISPECRRSPYVVCRSFSL